MKSLSIGNLVRNTLALLALLGCVAGASAGVGVPTTYTGLTWVFSSNAPGITACSRLVLDATGEPSIGTSYLMHGYLTCGGGAYSTYGNAYFAADGTLNFTVSFGAGAILVCTSLPGATFSGACTVYNGTATILGTATVTYL